MARSSRAPGAIGSDDYTGFSLILICVGLAILGWAGDRVLAETKAAAWAIAIMDAHHFTTPGLMSVLNAARLRSGVLAPAQFAFLKLVDRRLWYALHGLGFESDGLIDHPHPSQRVEAIVARAHWAAERAVGAPIPTPEFDAAIAAIRPKRTA